MNMVINIKHIICCPTVVCLFVVCLFCFELFSKTNPFSVGDLPFTNWGITNEVFEPDGANKCMKTCLDDANTDCDGKWKAEDCSSSLSYVCQIPCKKIPRNKDILLPEIVLTFHCLNKLF